MKRCFKTELQDGAARSNQKENQRTNERTNERWNERTGWVIALRDRNTNLEMCAQQDTQLNGVRSAQSQGPSKGGTQRREGKRRESEKVLIINYHLIYACVWWCYPSCCSCSSSLDSKRQREVGQGAVRLEHLRLAPSVVVVVELSLSIVPLSTTMFRFRFGFGFGFGFRSPCRDRND